MSLGHICAITKDKHFLLLILYSNPDFSTWQFFSTSALTWALFMRSWRLWVGAQFNFFLIIHHLTFHNLFPGSNFHFSSHWTLTTPPNWFISTSLWLWWRQSCKTSIFKQILYFPLLIFSKTGWSCCLLLGFLHSCLISLHDRDKKLFGASFLFTVTS